MTDNVLPFPGTPTPSNRTEKEEALFQELQNKGAEAVLKRIEANRKKGLEILEKKLDDFTEGPLAANAEVENLTREIIAALKGILLSLEALDNYSSLLAHDTSYLGVKQDKQGYDLFQAGAHLQSLIGVLEEKGYVTKEDLRRAWDRIIPDAVRDVQSVIRGDDQGE